MTWLLLAVLMVGLPLLGLLNDLARRDLARTLRVAEAVLRGEGRSS
jgi:hypothetical protein